MAQKECIPNTVPSPPCPNTQPHNLPEVHPHPSHHMIARALSVLKLSKDEIQRVCRHLQHMGHLPDPARPDELRRYRTALGEELSGVQVSMEVALAEAQGPEQVQHVQSVRDALSRLPPLRYAHNDEPIISGQWLMKRLQLQQGKLLGMVLFGGMVPWLHVPPAPATPRP